MAQHSFSPLLIAGRLFLFRNEGGNNGDRLLALLVVCAALATLAGCRQGAVLPEFGAPYEIVVDGSPGGPDTPPRISGDRLLATLAYTGGCVDHRFTLDFAVRRDTAHVWIVHEAMDDTCEMRLLDDLYLPLPLPVRSAPVIALYAPEGGPPYILRWAH